tara:strand:+ start:11380 stop:12198 length:819 start_codon:yes stop_codon:yes gene_type:complete
MSRAVLAWVLERLERGDKVALASIVEASGSVPGKPGARMALTNRGERKGTVGGAGLELKVENHLNEMLSSNSITNKVENYILHRDAKGNESNVLNSICGGQVTISLEVLEPMPHILIAGGGHCGKALADVCENLGWSHSVYDIRSEYSNHELYPNSLENHHGDLNGFLSSLSDGGFFRFSDILLLGHDWSIDQELLIGILKIRGNERRPRIGAIGSRSKWNVFRKAAIDQGISEEDIDSVRCPIGINIGAESPEEIAIAISAEIMMFEKKLS